MVPMSVKQPCRTWHYSDVIMDAMAFEITSLTIVYSTVYSRCRSKKTSKLRVTGLCAVNSPVASNAENVSIWWRHHGWSNHMITIIIDNVTHNKTKQTQNSVYISWALMCCSVILRNCFLCVHVYCQILLPLWCLYCTKQLKYFVISLSAISVRFVFVGCRVHAQHDMQGRHLCGNTYLSPSVKLQFD